MEVLSVNDPNAIKRALRVLQDGGIIVFPTETAYGLGGDWTKPAVHRKIRLIKGREKKKQLPVIVSSLVMARSYASFSDEALALTKKYWPGPLSLVLPLKTSPTPSFSRRGQSVVSPLRRGSERVSLSVRISPHPIALKLVRGLGEPLIATSANISGEAALYDARAVARVFAGRRHTPDLILDAGKLPRVRPSTVVAMRGNEIEVLREGPVKVR